MALVIVEGLARIIYTKPWHIKLLEEQRNTTWKASIRRNSQGLRDQDYPKIKPLHTHRVLILGDSFTFGSGVADDNVIFPELLEKQLNVEFSTQGEMIEILNGGIEGSLTHQWVDLLLKVQDSFQPDVILIVFFLRDGTTTSSMGSFFRPIRQEIESKQTDSVFYQVSYLVRLYQEFESRCYLAKKYSRVLNESSKRFGSFSSETV